jgi:hypothetical protein
VGIAFRFDYSPKVVSINYGLFQNEIACKYYMQSFISIERPSKLHTGYFEMTPHVGIAFKVGFTP